MVGLVVVRDGLGLGMGWALEVKWIGNRYIEFKGTRFPCECPSSVCADDLVWRGSQGVDWMLLQCACDICEI